MERSAVSAGQRPRKSGPNRIPNSDMADVYRSDKIS